MNRLKKFFIKYAFKIPKLKKDIKELRVNYKYLPKEWHYIKLKEYCDEIFETAKINIEVEGLENVPTGPCVFYPNHQSLIDPLLFFYIKKEVGFILKKELKKEELIDDIVTITNSLYIDRENVKEGMKTILQAIENIKNDNSYVVFPEGTRTGDELKDFHAGSFKMSYKTNTPIVPVTIIGTKAAVESTNMNPLTIKIAILPPIMPEEYKNLSTKEVADKTRNMIQDKLNKGK